MPLKNFCKETRISKYLLLNSTCIYFYPNLETGKPAGIFTCFATGREKTMANFINFNVGFLCNQRINVKNKTGKTAATGKHVGIYPCGINIK